MHPSNTKMSPWQLAALLIPGISATAVLGLPSITATFAMQDSWLAPIVAAPASALVIWLCGRLARRFPGETLIEYAPKALGIVPGKIAGALILWYFFHLDAAIAREFGELLVTTVHPRTPISAIMIFSSVCAGLAARYGPEILGRLGELFTPLALLMLSLIVAMSLGQMDLSFLKPVLEHGVAPVLSAAFATQAFTGQFILLAFLLPSVNKTPQGIKASYWALVVVVVCLTVVSVASIAAFGPVTPRLTWPFFKVARVASFGSVLARIDPIVIGFWIGGTYLKHALHLYAITLCFTQLLGLPDYRPFVFPMTGLVSAYAVGHVTSLIEQGHMLAYFWPPYTQIFQLLIPAAILAVAAIRQKGVAQRARG